MYMSWSRKLDDGEFCFASAEGTCQVVLSGNVCSETDLGMVHAWRGALPRQRASGLSRQTAVKETTLTETMMGTVSLTAVAILLPAFCSETLRALQRIAPGAQTSW
jgi:hypothetical protein